MLAGMLALVILVFSLVGLLAKDRAFSENENRSLAQKPQLTWQAVKDGSYLSDLSTYVADQFPGRDAWLSVNLGMHKLLGAKESGGVYLGEDDYLLQIPGEPNEEQFARNLTAMEAFAKAYPEINMVATVVPNAVSVLSEYLPANAPVRNQQDDLKQIKNKLSTVNFVDVSDTLEKHDDEQLFYRTDHHWTSLAAAYTFGKLASSFEITAPALSSYERYTVSTSFEGTLASKSGSHKVKDTGEIVKNTDKWLLTVEWGSLQFDGGVSANAPETFDLTLEYAMENGHTNILVDDLLHSGVRVRVLEPLLRKYDVKV